MEEEQVEKEEEVEKKEREERQEQMEAGWASPQPAAHTAAPHKCLENSCPLLHITIQCKRTMYTTVLFYTISCCPYQDKVQGWTIEILPTRYLNECFRT